VDALKVDDPPGPGIAERPGALRDHPGEWTVMFMHMYGVTVAE
jgi:hypothetical protein